MISYFSLGRDGVIKSIFDDIANVEKHVETSLSAL
jgi:hypothetical protein